MSEAYLAQMQAEWRGRGPELAAWIMRHLVNRTDVWGGYPAKRNRDKSQEKKSG